MPLQIRRGTNAERLAMTQALAQGELLYVTDDQRLYIGNGTTVGGVQITGYTDGDAKDAAAAAFTGGSHSGINFSYNTATDIITATVDLSSYNGSINAASLKGTLVADDSTLLVDAVDGKINLDGTVKGNITPNSNEAYDLGSASYRFRDIYLSSSGIKLGSATITSAGSTINLPAGSTIDGAAITSFNEGENLRINIVGDDSTVLVNTASNTLRGRFIGDMNGSVFADDSSILVDAVDSKFYGSFVAGNSTLASDAITGLGFSLGTAASPLPLTLNLDNNLEIRQVIGVTGKYLSVTQCRGTLASPTAVQADDELGGLLISGYTNSATPGVAGLIGVVVDSTAVIAGGSYIKSKIIISASTDTAQDAANAFVLDSAGTATSNAFEASKYHKLAVYANDAARTTAISSPSAGMMVFMTSGTSPSVTNKAVVYDGSAWVALH